MFSTELIFLHLLLYWDSLFESSTFLLFHDLSILPTEFVVKPHTVKHLLWLILWYIFYRVFFNLLFHCYFLLDFGAFLLFHNLSILPVIIVIKNHTREVHLRLHLLSFLRLNHFFFVCTKSW
jgi:hypothetical protein